MLTMPTMRALPCLQRLATRVRTAPAAPHRATPHTTHRAAPRHTAHYAPQRKGGPLLTAPASPPAAQVREATAPIYSGFVRLHGTAERARAERWAARQAARASLPERHGGVLAWLGLGLGLGVGFGLGLGLGLGSRLG